MGIALASGREAVRHGQWSEAIAAFRQAEEESALSADDLVALADSLWWAGQPDPAVETLERAFAAYEHEGRYSEAATVGTRLAYLAMRQLTMSIATAWIARVERMLEGSPESEGHGWLKLMHTAIAVMAENDLERGISLADEAIALGRRYSNSGIQAMAMSFKGVSLIYLGQWREGIKLVDEAAAQATSGNADLRAACDVYCLTIAACRNLGDFRRAGEWTDRAERWMHNHGAGGYPGICQVHRAELKRLQGSWSEAEQEARHAAQELERFHIMDGIGFAQYEIGEVRRRMGDFASAERAFLRAYEFGHNAQPGLSLLLLDQDQTTAAAKSIAEALHGVESSARAGRAPDVLSRGLLLPAQVEIALAAGDLDTAAGAVDELERLADEFESPTWQAAALTCRGSLLHLQGDNQGAAPLLERAWRSWQVIGLPFEAAQTRVILGRVRQALGNEVAAGLEFRAAASTFQQLGAAHSLRRLREFAGEKVGDQIEGRRERVTKVFMFTDIVTSTDLIGLIGDAAWENLLRWHDRTLREAIAAHGGEEVRHTGDGFFVAFDDPRAAIDGAVQVQRTLRQHRSEHGFSPWVRIGLHLAEATREAGDYSGQGVHAAARIGALADREEVLVSADLLAAAGPLPYSLSEPRPALLKGIAEPVTVVSVDWH
ncbi:MAG TPA: adenylate/guanylate cyclase domain-containing protein [Acidimicrobiia bacterium]|nr:adenylate/guanylate cyclase domain-containing protein [Acidimicrobiia bacterium]